MQDGRAEWSYVEHGHFSQTSVSFQSQLSSSGAPLTSCCLVRGPSAYVAPPPDFAHLLTAADHGCGDAMTSGRTCPLVVFLY